MKWLNSLFSRKSLYSTVTQIALNSIIPICCVGHVLFMTILKPTYDEIIMTMIMRGLLPGFSSLSEGANGLNESYAKLNRSSPFLEH